MRRSELLAAWRIHSVGILVWLVLLIPHSESLRGSAVVLQAKAKAAEAKQVEQVEDDASNGTALSNNSTKLHLTGIPQIDYVHDPNLPRELNGHNLTDYPFYNAIPEEIDFKCDGLHDGFYASVPHKCQVYHHCLYGFRYDFLCANYTAFDQKTFICHFVSEVDCENSPKHFKRNEDLYKEASTPASTTTTTTTTTPATTRSVVAQPAGHGGGGGKHSNPGRRRRPGPYRRRRPIMYDYYYDDEEYAEPEYYDDEAIIAQNHRRPFNRKQNKDSNDHHETRDTQDSETVDYEQPSLIKPSVRPSSGSIASSVYERPRVPPKIRRPVPKSERDKYDYVPKASSFSSTVAPTERTTTTAPAKKATTTAAPQPADDEYYEDEEYEYDEPRAGAGAGTKTKHRDHNPDYDFPTGFEDTHRYVPRPHRGRQPARKRTDMYDDYDVKERPRINRRKEYTRHEDRPRARPMYRQKSRQEEEVGYSAKKRPAVEPEHPRRRPEKRPTYDDEYYYDEEEELPPKRNRRPSKQTTEKPPPKPSTTKAPPKTERTSTTESKPTTAEPTSRPTKVTVSYSSTPQRSAKASSLENETTKENEIPTTEHISARTTQKYKTIKIPMINNVVREDAVEEQPADYLVSTEETRSSPTHSRPVTAIMLKTYPAKMEPTSKRPSSDDVPNKTITTIRHFVIAPPVRKPSHYGFVNTAPILLNASNFRDEVVASKLPMEQKTQQPLQHSNLQYSSRPSTQYIKIPVSMSSIAPHLNHSYHAPSTAFGGYYIPIEQPLKSASKQPKPVEEPLSENLNAISNGITYNNAFESTKSQPYRGAAAAAQQPSQDQRLYSNALSFPQRAPPSYDITAPGPSAPAEETNSATADSKRYSELPSAYTANADYDVTYNDALQPSTLHPVRRFPSTTFYSIQTHQNAPPRRQTSEYAFNDATFHTLNRSQKNRYSK